MPIHEASWHKNLSPHSSSRYILQKQVQKNKSISTIHLLLSCPCVQEKLCLYLENRINTEAIFTSLVLQPPQILFVVSARECGDIITRMKIFSAGGNGIIKKQRNKAYECFVLLGTHMPFKLCRVLIDRSKNKKYIIY